MYKTFDMNVTAFNRFAMKPYSSVWAKKNEQQYTLSSSALEKVEVPTYALCLVQGRS